MKRKPLTLRSKLNLFVGLNTLLGLTLMASGFSYLIIQDQFRNKGQEAQHLAETVANIPQVVDAFRLPRPETVIQPLVERIRREVGAKFIVVANRQAIRYSHPNPNEIGRKMTDQDGPLLLNGKSIIYQADGTLGLSIRARVPIFNTKHQQIGIVSVGFLVSSVWRQITLVLMEVAGIGLGALILNLIGIYALSGSVKRSIFGMEPTEIAQLVQEQSAIMQSIQEGILAINSEGYITACNDQAQRILEMDTSAILGKHLLDVVPDARLCAVIADGPNFIDQPMIIGTTMIVVNRVPVLLGGEVIGAVVTFRDKMQLDQMERRLEAIDKYTDALRSQRHEFMNRLHTIAGLVQLKEYDLVRELIDEINNEQHQVLDFFANRIRDPAVLAIIIGKMHRAKELGIQLNIAPSSILSENCPHRDVIVTVLGNALDNAMEAIVQDGPGAGRPATIIVSVGDDPENIVLTVKDSGPGIDPKLGNQIFDDAVSTKGPGRGFGLSLCSRLVAQANGRLAVLSSAQGATLEMVLPKGEKADVV